MEAVIGAVYIDGGTAAAYGLIERLVGDRLTSSASLLDHLDYKTALQELSARLFERAPVYVLREEGPDHAKHFFASVAVDGRQLGEGEGRSKKQAEQVAARMACEQLRAAAIGPGREPAAPGGRRRGRRSTVRFHRLGRVARRPTH